MARLCDMNSTRQRFALAWYSPWGKCNATADPFFHGWGFWSNASSMPIRGQWYTA